MLVYGPFFSIQLLVLIILGFWGKSIAERKGYSGIFGFLVGFFGALLGILLLAVIPHITHKKSTIKNIKAIEVPRKEPDSKPVEYSKTGDSTSYFCPHCFKEVEVIDGYLMYECPHCKGKFTL